MIRQEPRTTGYFLRRGTLYGAAVGLLLGLAAVGIAGYGGQAAIIHWRHWILGGAVVGLVSGAIRAACRRGDEQDEPNQGD